jgi:hypothetical protein
MRGAVAAVALAVGVSLGACGPESHRPFFHDDRDDLPEFSAARLGDPMEEGAIMSMLSPAEREAVRRAGLPLRDVEPPAAAAAAEPPPARERTVGDTLDTAGKATLAALGVAVSVGAMVAPYLLF